MTVKSGQEFIGILQTGDPDKEIGVALAMAREKVTDENQLLPKLEPLMIIQPKDFVQLVSNEVNLYNDESVEGAVKNQGARCLTSAYAACPQVPKASPGSPTGLQDPQTYLVSLNDF